MLTGIQSRMKMSGGVGSVGKQFRESTKSLRPTCDTDELLLDTITSQPASMGSPGRHDPDTRLGIPSNKSVFVKVDVVLVAVSLLCLIAACLTITSASPIAWYLQYTGQIIVIGFLLSIMKVCMTTLLPYANLLLEARFGESRLQNYDALYSGRIFGRHVSLIWRCVLVLLAALPIGLSVAYKTFLYGTSMANIPPDFSRYYGIDFPQIGDYAPANDPIYLLTTSIGPFRTAWTNSPYPSPSDFPVAYGYNTLLLSNSSSAVLDVPTIDSVKQIQNSMTATEWWCLNATVNAFVVSYDPDTQVIRNDNNFWSEASNSGSQMMSISTYTSNMSIGYVIPPSGQMLLGLYNDPTGSPGMGFYDLVTGDDSVVEAFRAVANLYDIRRVQCSAVWHINRTSISLYRGYCDPSAPVRQDIVDDQGIYDTGFWPYVSDTLPVLSHLFRNAANSSGWPWLDATYAVSVATMYWARAVYLIKQNEAYPWNGYINYSANDDSILYPSRSEYIRSYRFTLRDSGLLYLVLTTQPFITILAFIISLGLSDMPIGRRFGIIPLLSGFDPSSPHLISGAGLSGELKAPVRLHIDPELPDPESIVDEQPAHHHARIRYRIASCSPSATTSKLKRNKTYW